MPDIHSQPGTRIEAGSSRSALPPLLLAALLLIPVHLPCQPAAVQQTAGWVEHAVLQSAGIELQAKLDTGADNSSLHAEQMQGLIRNGREYVRFRVSNSRGQTAWLEEAVLRHARIKRQAGLAQERPVVMLTICLGGISRGVEVNLTDRSGFDYPLLLGRSFLQQGFLIDPGASYRLSSGCPATTGE